MRNCTRLSLARMKLGWECDGRRKWQEFDWLWVSAAVSVVQGIGEWSGSEGNTGAQKESNPLL